MLNTTDAPVGVHLASLDLNDDERILAMVYLQSMETLAILRRNALFANVVLVMPALLVPSLPDNTHGAFAAALHLAHALGRLGPVMLLVVLAISAMGASFLHRELVATAVADTSKKRLQTIAADMEMHVLKRPFRRLADWLVLRFNRR